MFNTILNPDDAKQARAAVGLSQSKVAQATGISRTNLALFEVKKYLLDDDTLTKIKQFYQDAGYSFPVNSTVEQSVSTLEPVTDTPEETSFRLMDGFAVPIGIPEEEAELILNEIHANDTEIETLLDKKSGMHWWTEKPNTNGVNRLLVLHARNYVLTRRLQGHELLNNLMRLEDTPLEEVTNSMLFNKAVSA
jgi:DNA-binding XRE family transcriptional regulator